jgi:hypothetical protein
MFYGHPLSEEPSPVNADQRIPMGDSVRLNENPFWSRLQHDRQATASLIPKQPSKEESSITTEIFLNAVEEDIEELSPFNSEDMTSLSTTVDRRTPLRQSHLDFTVFLDQERAALDALFSQIDIDESPWSTFSEQITVMVGALPGRMMPTT